MSVMLVTGRLLELSKSVKTTLKKWRGTSIKTMIVLCAICTLFTPLLFSLFTVNVMRSRLAFVEHSLTRFWAVFVLIMRGNEFG